MGEGLVLPDYYNYYERPVKLVETPSGGMAAWQVQYDSDGSWIPANNLIDRILFANLDELMRMRAPGFVVFVELFRAKELELAGDAPVFTLYDTIRTMYEVAEAEDRELTAAEWALVQGIARRSYVMFEERLRAAGNQAADPDLLAREGGPA
jgi:hypothetical protein